MEFADCQMPFGKLNKKLCEDLHKKKCCCFVIVAVEILEESGKHAKPKATNLKESLKLFIGQNTCV